MSRKGQGLNNAPSLAITERKRAEENLKERVKELNCLYGIGKIAERPGITLDELYQEVVKLLPQSWQYPEISCARIIIKGRKFETQDYQDSEWKQSSDIKIYGAKAGTVDVGYLEARPEIDEGPFLKEERLLIDAVAERLGRITERKLVEEALQQSQRNLRAYLESAPDGVYLNDLKGTFLYGNKKAEELTGYKRGELIGKSFLELNLLPTKYLAKVGKLLALNAMGRPTGPDEFELTRKDGSRTWVEINTTPVKQKGKAVIIGFVRDITERKRAREALQESEQKYRALFKNLNDAAFLADVETGRILDTNRRGEALLGRTREEIIGMHQSELHPPEMANEYRQRFATHVQKGRAADYDGEAVRKDGSIVPVSISAATFTIGEKQVILGLFRDITERKRAEEELRESEGKYRALVENATDFIYMHDRDGRVLSLNKSTASLLGKEPRELIGKTLFDIFPKEIATEFSRHMKRVFETGKVRTAESKMVAGKKEMWISTSLSPVKDYEDKVVAVIGVSRDITERKRLEQEIQKKNEQLDAQNEELRAANEELIVQQQELMEKTRELETVSQAKNAFLANMSHELRTPLNAVIGFSELMLDGVPGEISDEQRQCLSDILSSGQHLLNLVNDVLDLSKVEAGRMELKLENLNMADVINDVVQTVKPILGKNRLKIGVSIAEGPPQVYADKIRLRQIFLNLLSNAIKFALPGSKLGIETGRESDWYQVSVVDNGIGIKKEDQERIFEAFSQVETLPDRKKKGTGLGLLIARQFVETMGGRIWVESEYGKGSKFTFTLPLAISDIYPEEGNRR